MQDKKIIAIRKATPDDAGVIIRFQQAMAMETERLELNTETVTKGVMAVFHDPKKGQYYVAEENNSVVASLMITYEWSDWRNAWLWWIQSVYVRPEARGKRVYSHLYDFVKTLAREKGVYGIRLYVEHDNYHAQRVYEKVGMEKSHYIMYEEML